MTTTTLLINTSARKIHQSTTVNITPIWKIYPPREPKSQQKYKGTLEKPSPLKSLQLQNHPSSRPKKVCRAQKVNPRPLQIRSQRIYGEKQHPSCYRVICSRRKKERRSDRLGSLCAVMHQKNSQWSYWEHLGNAKYKGYPRKRENIQNVGARKSKIE